MSKYQYSLGRTETMNRLHPDTHHPFNSTIQIFLFLLLTIFIFSSCTQIPQQGHQDFQNEPSIDVLIPGTFTGPDDQPIPFTHEHELLNFLKTAQVQDEVKIPTGITKPRKLLLEKDGIKTHAVFHYRHYVNKKETLKNGQVIRYFRDSYLNQVAAYEMSRLLGMPNVPPTVLRNVEDKEGSVQLWIENAINESDRLDQRRFPPDRSLIDLRAHDMRVFDNLINNTDRNLTNILYDPNWRLWLIDHTRAFGRSKELPDHKRLRKCSRSLWKKLQSLDKRLVKEKLRPYMGSVEISRIFYRRDEIVNHFKEKITAEGEENVLFIYPKP